MNKGGYIYIMTNKYKTTLYIGVTNDLRRRIWEYRTHYIKDPFSDKYNLESCIYYEYFPIIEQAIDRETEIKKWSRNKKEKLIAALNPDWSDLWEAILGN